jgi:hypothetical protein
MSRTSILLIAVVLILSRPVLAQDTNFVAVSYPGSQSVGFTSKVQTLVTSFTQLIDSTNAPLLGFTAPVSAFSLGEAIPVGRIDLTDVDYQSARAACTTFATAQIPVYQNSQPGAMLEVTGTLPDAIRFGYAALGRRVLRMMDSLAYFSGLQRNTMFLVTVPAFNLVFLARQGTVTGEVYLRPVYSYPSYGLFAGVEQPLQTMWTVNLAPNMINRSSTLIR